MRRPALPPACLLALSCLGSGCTVGPDFRTPEPPAVQRYARGDAPLDIATPGRDTPALAPGRDIPAEWWSLFGSPKLDALVRRALAASPTLAAARARLVQAEEERNARAGATEQPAVNGSLGISREQIDPATLGFPQAPTPGPFTLYSVGVQVSYTFDLFGGTRRELEALAAEVDYRRYELEGAQLALAANVATSAIRQAGLRAQIDATARILDSQRRTLAIMQGRLAAGGVARADVENQRVLVAQTAATLPPLATALAQTEHILAIYVGQAPSEAALPELTLADLRLPRELPLTLPSQLAQQRPDLRASEALLHKASANLGVATANLYPKLTLSASATPTQLAASDLAGGGINIWNVGASLLQPLFRGGELKARERAAAAAFDQAAALYRDSVLQAFRNVADVLRALEGDTRSLAARTTQAEHAETAWRIAIARRDAGGVSGLAVLDAERTRLSAELARAQAEADRYADAAALMQALGGGWWSAR